MPEPGRRRAADVPVIFYNSFHGRFSDNPRAIYEELVARGVEAEHVWTARDETRGEFPRGARTVVPGSEEHLREVNRADFIVSNVEMRESLRKRPGVVFLQTWHGTPLKRIGYDNRYVHAHPAAFERDVEEYEKWDFLVSPNSFSTEVFSSSEAFRGFRGEIIETGYPRNDILSSSRRGEVRDAVRAELGIEEGQTAILYAPTWRDNLFHEQGADAYSLTLDTDEVTRRLGDDSVLLLRLHFLVAASIADGAGPGVRNVSAYTDVRDLYLAADVLVTDYSSVMFDFAITGKPMIFYAYDLEHYRDVMRGFYFDYEAEIPGPLCRTTDEVIDALTSLPRIRERYIDSYEHFRRRFCHLEDGGAAGRVVERVFAESFAEPGAAARPAF